MRIVETIDGLGAWRGSCVLVPTMGALHAGHADLIRRAATLARSELAARGADGRRGVVVSVFVNPTQFNEKNDFERYPRTLESDAALAARAGADAVFAPSVPEMYPRGLGAGVPALPAAATEPKLEDAHRPGHFAGVCQVVRRLFEATLPAVAVFGEKDWQQLQVVRQMTAVLGLGIEIVGVPTVREPDGLAMSSRNVFLSAADRGRALSISRALRAAGGLSDAGAAERDMRAVLDEAGVVVEYATVRDGETLRAPGAGACRALIAGRVGAVRLIDNAPWPGWGASGRGEPGSIS